MFRSSNVLAAEPAVTATSSILAGLTPAQAEAASLSGAVLVLAGAGTGKTKTLTSGVAWRIQARGIPASRILAVTFTNKAAGEMTERIRRMLAGREVPSWCGTFHGLGARQLRAEPEVAGLRTGFDILDADDSKRLVKRVLKAMAVDPAELGSDRDPVQAGLPADRPVQGRPGDAGAGAGPGGGADRRGAPDPPSGGPGQPAPGGRGSTPSTSAGCARRTRRTSATCCCGPRSPCSATAPTGSAGPDASTACWQTNTRTCAHAQYSWLRLLSAGHGEIFVVG